MVLDAVMLEDINGQKFLISVEELSEMMIREGVTMFGMDTEAISELRLEYTKRNGRMPITKESVKEVFNV